MTDQLSKLFQQIKSQIDQKEKQILGDIQSHEKKQLADIMVLSEQTDKKREAAAQSLLELQALADQTDACLFLKVNHCIVLLWLQFYTCLLGSKAHSTQ